MTALRAQQQASDAEVERQRSLLGQEYASAIRQAQADNDMAKAQALYDRATVEDVRLSQQKLLDQQRTWQLEDIQSERDYNDKVLQQQRTWDLEDQKTAASGSGGTGASAWDMAKFVAEESGDFTLVGQLLGMNQAEINRMNGVTPDQTESAVEAMGSIYNDTKVNASPSQSAYDFVSRMPSWQQVQRDTPGYTSYEEYVATAVDAARKSGQLSDADVKWLINRYSLWTIL
jgi:hypothetical protein